MLRRISRIASLTAAAVGLMIVTGLPAKATQLKQVVLLSSLQDSVNYPGSTPSIKAFDLSGNYIENLSTPANTLNEPDGISIGPDGNIYVSDLSGDTPNGKILRYNGTTGNYIDTFVPTGSGTGNTKLYHPSDAIFGADGNLYVSSYSNYPNPTSGLSTAPAGSIDSIQEFNGQTGAFIKAFAGPTPVFGPTGLVFGPDGKLYVSSFANSSILRYDTTTGAVTTFIAPNTAGLTGPAALLFDNSGNLLVADYGQVVPGTPPQGNQILKFSSNGTFLGKIASGLTGYGQQIDGPISLNYSPSGQLWVAGSNNSVIDAIDPNTGALIKQIVTNNPANGNLVYPELGMAFTTLSVPGIAAVPEPSVNLSLLGLGALGLGALVKRELKKREY